MRTCGVCAGVIMLLCALVAPCRPDEDTRRAARVRARMWAPHRLHLHLRGGAKKGVGRGEALPVPSATRVKFPKTPIRRGRESEREESSRSWQEHSRSLGAPDGKHTPGWPAAGKVRKRRGSDRQAPTASSDDEETLAGEESSVRFARLGAPDGKHTPAVSRSGARWPELFDSSTEVPARSVSPEGHLRAAAPLSSSKASQPSSRRVLFSDVPADAHSDLQAQASTQTKLPRPRPRRTPSTADNLAGEPGKRAHKKRKHSTPDPSSSEESGSGSEAGEEEDRTEEGGASGETRQEASSDSPSDTSHESIQDDSDYEDVMRMRRNKHAPVTGQVHGRPGGDYGRDTRTQTKTCGVGMLLESSAQSLFRVTKLAPGGAAAEHGGVVLDDLIHSVDSTSVRGMSLQQAAACICGPPGTFVTLEMLRGKKQIPVSVRLQRRPLHPSAEAPPSSTDARIADLVEELVAELGAQEERDRVWSVWQTLHPDAASVQDERGQQQRSARTHGYAEATEAEDTDARKGSASIADKMRPHDSRVDALLQSEEQRRQRRVSKERAKQDAMAKRAAAEPQYRGARAVHQSAGARRQGFRQRTKEAEHPARGGADLFKDLQRLNAADALKGNSFGARSSKRSGTKERKKTQVEGLRVSQLATGRKKLRVDCAGL